MWLWGRHAVTAALANPERACTRLLGTRQALDLVGDRIGRAGLAVHTVEAADLDRRLPGDAAHQGLLLEVAPLPPLALADVTGDPAAPRLLLALDQVTDPRNLGAILRSAAALGVAGVVLPRHGSAELGGACAKAASGALDRVPIVEVVNLARALEEVGEAGFSRIGLVADGPELFEAAVLAPRNLLVLGAEGRGLRRLTALRCDRLARLAIDPSSDSLNVSVAAGIALYLAAQGLRCRGEG